MSNVQSNSPVTFAPDMGATPANNFGGKGPAEGFINFSFTTKSGKTVRLDGIPMRSNNKVMANLIARLNEDPEAVIDLINTAEVTYNQVGKEMPDDELDF